jgi:hypothetical protein
MRKFSGEFHTVDRLKKSDAGTKKKNYEQII